MRSQRVLCDLPPHVSALNSSPINPTFADVSANPEKHIATPSPLSRHVGSGPYGERSSSAKRRGINWRSSLLAIGAICLENMF